MLIYIGFLYSISAKPKITLETNILMVLPNKRTQNIFTAIMITTTTTYIQYAL